MDTINMMVMMEENIQTNQIIINHHIVHIVRIKLVLTTHSLQNHLLIERENIIH